MCVSGHLYFTTPWSLPTNLSSQFLKLYLRAWASINLYNFLLFVSLYTLTFYWCSYIVWSHFHFVIHFKNALFLLLRPHRYYLRSDHSLVWPWRSGVRPKVELTSWELPCGGRKRAFEWWDSVRRERLILYQRAVWKWCYFSGLNFNYIWARHWRLNRGLGLVRANSWQHSSCYCSCVNCETKTILMEVCGKMLMLCFWLLNSSKHNTCALFP